MINSGGNSSANADNYYKWYDVLVQILDSGAHTTFPLRKLCE